MKFTRIIAACTLVTACTFIDAPISRAQSQWPMCDRDRECSSWARTDTTLAPPFKKTIIQFPAPYATISNLYVDYLTYSDGLVYCGCQLPSDPNLVYAINPATGLSPWRASIAQTGGAFGMAPVIAGDVILAAGQGISSHLLGCDKRTGSVLWEKLFTNMYARQATVDNGLVYFRTDTLLCMNPINGSIVWNRPLQRYTGAGSVAADDTHLFFSQHDTLYCAMKADGATLWKSAPATQEGLCIDDANVYVSADSTVRAVRKLDHRDLWTHAIPKGQTVAYVNGNGMAIDATHVVYAMWGEAGIPGTLTALDKTTGTVRWTHVFPAEGVLSPTIANGIVYTVDWKTYALWGFNIETGAVVFKDSSRIFRTKPIVANGTLYVGAMNPDSLGWSIAAYTSVSTGVHEAAPDRVTVQVQAYPNPFTTQTAVSYTLPDAMAVQIELFDMLGRRVAVIDRGLREGGSHLLPFTFDAPDAPASGCYILRLAAGGHVATCPLIHRR